ncbi:SLC13 family permease [Clostridium sp.]|uniref:SLC13 family permease n=1 Tax=Clostridium sp. TaxID=1506 RepID=UPI00321650F1
MTENVEYEISNENLSLINKITTLLKKEAVLTIASILAIITSFFALPKLEYIDFKVLILLFNLMIVVVAFKKLKLFDAIATSLLSKCRSFNSISYTLVLVTFFSSMVLTNDVALITFVPLTLIIANKAKIDSLNIIVFQTIAANLGSALTPMGNPQNLFIYSFFNISPMDFFKITLPLVILSLMLLVLFIMCGDKKKLSFTLENVDIDNVRNVILYSILFFVILLSVFHLIDYRLTFVVTLLTVFLLDKDLFKEVDYSLLLTFIAFFIFIGNISSMDVIKDIMAKLLSSEESTYISSIVASQFISNVPATMLISPFTSYYRELLLGVNIGGLGTLIASLASVISYKLYVKENPKEGFIYVKIFTLYNIFSLALLGVVTYMLI